MKRKLLTTILIGMTALCIAGCGKDKDSDVSQKRPQNESNVGSESESSGKEESSPSGGTEDGTESSESSTGETEIEVNNEIPTTNLAGKLMSHAKEVFESATQRYSLSVHLEQDRTNYSVFIDETGTEVRDEEAGSYDYQSVLDIEVDHDFQCTGITVKGTEVDRTVDTDVFIEDTEIAYTTFVNSLTEENKKTGWNFYSNPAGSIVEMEAPDWNALAESAKAEKTEDGRYRLTISAPLSTASQIAAYYCKYGVYRDAIEVPVTIVFMFTEEMNFESCSVYNEETIEVPGGVIRKYSTVIKEGNGGLLEESSVPMEVKKEAYGLE